MKKYNGLIFIVSILVITIILCFIFIKPKVLNFKNINEYTYFENHIDEIEKIVIETYTLLGVNLYLIDNEIGKEFLLNLKIKKEVNYTVTDSNATLYVYYKSGEKTEFNFEHNSFKYGNKKYEVNNEIWNLVNESNKIE